MREGHSRRHGVRPEWKIDVSPNYPVQTVRRTGRKFPSVPLRFSSHGASPISTARLRNFKTWRSTEADRPEGASTRCRALQVCDSARAHGHVNMYLQDSRRVEKLRHRLREEERRGEDRPRWQTRTSMMARSGRGRKVACSWMVLPPPPPFGIGLLRGVKHSRRGGVRFYGAKETMVPYVSRPPISAVVSAVVSAIRRSARPPCGKYIWPRRGEGGWRGRQPGGTTGGG